MIDRFLQRRAIFWFRELRDDGLLHWGEIKLLGIILGKHRLGNAMWAVNEVDHGIWLDEFRVCSAIL